MPRKRRTPKTRRAEIHPDMMAILSDREPSSGSFKYFSMDAEFEGAWNEVRDEILADWIANSPGTRPSFWWRFDAPRQRLGNFPGCYYDGKLPEPRVRLGGTGTPDFEVLNYVPSYSYGIPDGWVSQWDESYYNGRSHDIHGERIGTEYEEGHFAGVAIDPGDPPRYESEASYLERHGLFLPGEKRRLRKADFEPDLVMPEEEGDDEAEAPNNAA